MTQAEGFPRWFERATGHGPYAYQEALAGMTVPPSVLEVPTGGGKTQALLGAWLFQRRTGTGPRRLVYALPMRSLVEQTKEVAEEMRTRLRLTAKQLPIHILMGGEDPPEEDWRLRPAVGQILVGTIDMLLSRALNRGYAESRFTWPVAFGLLNADCRWVFDEVQLMGPARATSAQLDGLRTALGTTLPCETLWVSATVDKEALTTVDRPELGAAMTLPDRDRTGPLRARLHATKTLARVDFTDVTTAALPRSITDVVLERHLAGTRTLVVLNTVELAQATFAQIAKSANGPQPILLHSRFRPPERKRHMDEALADPEGAGIIVIATQVVEAGIDMSSRTLVTETAPFSSIVQRLGRCNRAGEYHDQADVVWLDRGPAHDDSAGRTQAAPYSPANIRSARQALLKLEGESLSPAALEQLERVPESADDPTVLRRRDLLDLFDTSPDLSGTDIDIAPFIRDDEERTVTVLFRELPDDPGGRLTDQPAPEPDELVQVPRASVRDRDCWIVDHVEAGWRRIPAREVPPGATVLLRAAHGGYDPDAGWDPKSRRAVTPIPLKVETEVEGVGSDTWTKADDPQELLAHLNDVATETAGLVDALQVPVWREVLHAAASLHDFGKAHPIFQATLRKAIDPAIGPDRDERLWAKSGRRGGRHERRYFRHELASALAIPRLDGVVEVPRRELTAYLVAAHHGKVRLSIRPAPGEERPRDAAVGARFALGIVDGDALPEVDTPIGRAPAIALDLASMELGATDSWTDAALALRDDPTLGPFRLGFLEALLRVADWRASA